MDTELKELDFMFNESGFFMAEVESHINNNESLMFRTWDTEQSYIFVLKKRGFKF